ISEKAVLYAKKQGLKAALTQPEGPLPFDSSTFDLIIAIFVMHFNIPTPTLVELRRVLLAPGKFIFNIYQRDIDEVVEQLEEAGFCSIEEISSNQFKINPHHKIISCGILSS